MTFLAETRRLTMPPSTNLPQRDDASWVALLPGGGSVVCIGDPGRSVAAALRRHTDRVVRADGQARFDGDVVVVASDDRELVRACHPYVGSGAVIVQLPGSAQMALDRAWLVIRRRERGLWERRLRRVSTLLTARVASILGLEPPSAARRHASDVSFLSIPADLRDGPDDASTSIGWDRISVPDYIREIAQADGMELSEGGPWQFAGPRGYESQKVVFRVQGPSGGVIVKLTQHPRFNPRLAAEGVALRRWAGHQLDHVSLPAQLFAGEHRGLLVLGESEIAGVTFRARAGVSNDDPIAELGAAAIVELGARSVSTAPASDVASAMTQLVDDFDSVFSPPKAVRSQLEECAFRLGRSSLPTVFVHGDFGVWNLTVTPDGRLGVLDWENADPTGMPLWDLFVYARTLGVLHADLGGARYTARTFRRQLLEPSPLRSNLLRWTREYCRVVDFPTDSVDDAFTMCWVQQAVREAAGLVGPKWGASRGTHLLAATLGTRFEFDG